MYLSINDPGCYRKAYRYDQDNYRIALNYAKYLEDRGKKEEALELYKRAYALNNNCFEARQKIKELSQKAEEPKKEKCWVWKKYFFLGGVLLLILLLFKGCVYRTNAVKRSFAYTFLEDQSQFIKLIKGNKKISTFSVPAGFSFKDLEQLVGNLGKKDEAIVFYKENGSEGEILFENEEKKPGRIFAYAEPDEKNGGAKLYVNSYGGLPLLDLRLNYLRTAAFHYIIDKGTSPLSLSQLKEEGYILNLPVEPLTFSSRISNSLDGGGGWVFDPAVQYSANLYEYLEKLIYPNLLDYSKNFSPLKIIVDTSDFTLSVWSGEEKVYSCPVGLGKEELTPLGNFFVEEIIIPSKNDPVYGNGILALSVGEIAIHGTNDLSSIGNKASLGYIRVKNEDMSQLLSFIPKGTAVEIKAGEQGDKIQKVYKD